MTTCTCCLTAQKAATTCSTHNRHGIRSQLVYINKHVWLNAHAHGVQGLHRHMAHLERAHEGLIYTHHGSSIVKLSTVVGRREYCHKLSLGKELVAIFYHLQYPACVSFLLFLSQSLFCHRFPILLLFCPSVMTLSELHDRPFLVR